MGRPLAGLDDYLEWQRRLRDFEGSGLTLRQFCLQGGFSKPTYYAWVKRLQHGIPQEVLDEQPDRDLPDCGPPDLGPTPFLPVALRTSPVEVELPNGARLRVPVGVGQAALLEVLRFVADLPPRRAAP